MKNSSTNEIMATLRKEYRKKESPGAIYSSHLTIQEDSTLITNEVEEVVFGALNEHGSVTRMKLVEITGLPRTTVYDSLTRLILKGFVRKYDEKRNHRGRPKVYYQLSV